MRIIIVVKDTATLSRIDEFEKALRGQPTTMNIGFQDVIKSISKEW